MITSLLAILGCSLVVTDAELSHIKTTQEYKKFKSGANQHAIYFYNILSDYEREKAFGLGVRDLLAVVDGQLEAVDLEIPLAYADCNANEIAGLCDSKEVTSNKDFFMILLYDNRRDTILRLQPRDSKLNEHDLLDLILRFYALGWRNFHAVSNGKEARKTLEANPQKDWFVCYADRDHDVGKTFCLELAAVYRKRSAIGIVQIEKKSVLQQLGKHLNVELELPSKSSPFSLWYFDCLEDEGIQCKSYQYLMDQSIINARHFVQMVEMSVDGTIPDLHQFQCSLLYYFYRGVKLRWDAAKTQAFDVGSQLRGAAIVVVADVDELKESTLAKFGINAKRDSFPIWRLKMVTPESSKTVPPGFIHVEGCPVEFVKRELRSLYDTSSHFDSAPVDSSHNFMSDDDDIDPKTQDDEVELLLQAQRDEACYFCPPDYKRVTVLTDKTYMSFIEKRKTAIVLFWLNVDTTSRAALAVTTEASTLLDVNYAPFGAVACHDWPDVCQKASVKTWPKMVVFSNGQRMREYKSVWDPKLLANSAMLYAAPALTQLSSADDLENFIHSKSIRLINNTYLQTITVGLFKNEKAREIRALSEAAKKLHGQYAFGLASGAWVKNWVNERMGPLELPVIVTHKNNDELEKAVLMDEVEEATPESITRFVQISSRPVIAPLTKLTFPSIISRKVPIVILISSSPKESEFYAILRNVEECLLSRNYVCVTLDADTERNLTVHLLKAYGLHESQLPVVVYVNPKNGHVHLLTSSGTQKSIKIWLEHINSKMVKPAIILPKKTWSQRPLVHDYLELTRNAKPDSTHRQPTHEDQSDAGWRKKKNARPWGKPEYEQETEGMDGMETEMETQKEQKTCMRNKKLATQSQEDRKLATGKKDELMDADAHGHDWHEKHECPMKRMAAEMRRKEEESDKKNGRMMQSEEAEPETIENDDGPKQDDIDKAPIVSKNTRKITKDILEEEERKAQRKKPAHEEEDGRDEL